MISTKFSNALRNSKGILFTYFCDMKVILFFIFLSSFSIKTLARIELPIEQPTGLPTTSQNSDTIKTSIDHTLLPPAVDSSDKKIFSTLSWINFLNEVNCSGKKYYLDFTASWCGPCKMMDRQVFNDEKVIATTHQYYLAKQIDIDDFEGIAIAQKYNINSIPTILIFDNHAKLLRRLEGFQYADMFVNQLLIHK